MDVLSEHNHRNVNATEEIITRESDSQTDGLEDLIYLFIDVLIQLHSVVPERTIHTAETVALNPTDIPVALGGHVDAFTHVTITLVKVFEIKVLYIVVHKLGSPLQIRIRPDRNQSQVVGPTVLSGTPLHGKDWGRRGNRCPTDNRGVRRGRRG